MKLMTHEYDDGGRKAAGYKGDTGDCVTRALAIVTGRPYQEIYDALSRGMGSQRLTKRHRTRKASAANGVSTGRKWFKDYARELGLVWVPTMEIGTGCRVHLAKGELPTGRLAVRVSKHYTAVIDGVIRDTYDPQREETHDIVTVGALYELQQGERRLGDGMPCGNFQIARPIGGRCVYGYWRLA